MKKPRTKRRQEAAPISQNYLLYRLDYERYIELRPLLRAAGLPAEFEPFCTTPDLEEILTALEDGQATPETLRQEIVRAECCVGTPLVLDAAFPRFVRELAHRSNTEITALQLSELIAGNKHIEQWFRADAGLRGILTPQETRMVSEDLRKLFRPGVFIPLRRKGRKRRRGGLLGFLKTFVRGMMAVPPSEEEILYLLDDLLRDATREGQGVALTV